MSSDYPPGSSQANPYSYIEKQKELTLVGKRKGRLDAEIKALDSEMEAFISKHEAELNMLLQDYSVLRGQTGKSLYLNLGSDADGKDEYVNALSERLELNEFA